MSQTAYERSIELREKIVPNILGLIRLSENERRRKAAIAERFPTGILKVSAWQSGGLDSPEDILRPERPEACYTHALFQAVLRAHDEYEVDRLQRRDYAPLRGGRPSTEPRPMMTRQRTRALFEAYVSIYYLRYRLDASAIRTWPERARALTDPQWRALFYNSDVYFRAGVYDWLRQEHDGARPWREVSAAVASSIADAAHEIMYGDRLRVFHAYKDKDQYLAVPTHHDLAPDLIRGFMRDEVRKIGERERISHDHRTRGIIPLPQGLPEWKTVRPFNAVGLWAFSAKQLTHKHQ